MSIREEQGSEQKAGATSGSEGKVEIETVREGRIGEEESPAKTPERFEERLAQAMAGATEENARPGTAVEGRIAEAVEGGVAQAKEAALEGAEKLGGMARNVRTTSREAAQSMRSVAKRHPIPAALTGLGAACAGIGATCLLVGERRRAPTAEAKGQTAPEESIAANQPAPGEQHGRIEAMERRAEGALTRASHETQDLAKRAQASVEEAAHGAAARVERVARDARAEAQLLGERAEKTFRDHPLAVGAGLVAFGTAVGMSLPSTVRENRWLGKRREAFVGRARSAARSAGRKLESLGKSAPAPGH